MPKCINPLNTSGNYRIQVLVVIRGWLGETLLGEDEMHLNFLILAVSLAARWMVAKFF